MASRLRALSTCILPGLFALAILGGGAVSTASAQPSSRELATARELFRSGVSAGEAGNWGEALDDFQRAYALSQRADVLLNVAAAQVELGRLLDAGETYRRFRAEADPAMLEEHGAAVTAALADIEARSAHVRIRLENSGASDSVSLDGEPLRPEELGVDLPLDPGEHVVALTRGGVALDERRIILAEGARNDLTLRGEGEEVASSPHPTPVDEGEQAVDAAPIGTPGGPAPEAAYDPTGWIIVGVIGGVLVIGGVTLGVALGTSSNTPASFDGSVFPGSFDIE